MSAVLYQADHPVTLPGDTGLTTGICGTITITWAVLGKNGKTVYRRSKATLLAADSAKLMAGVAALVSTLDSASIAEPVKVDLKISHFLPTEALETEPTNARHGAIGFKNEVNDRIKSSMAVWYIRPDDQIEEIIAAVETNVAAADCFFGHVKQADTMVDYVQYPCDEQDYARYFRRNELTNGEVTPTHPEDDIGGED